MQLFNKFKDWLTQTGNSLKLKKIWTQMVKSESENPSADFIQLGIRSAGNGKVFYDQKTLIPLWAQIDEEDRMNQIVKEFAPSYNFLSSLMDYEDVVVPDIITFSDESGNLSLSYGCVFSFSSKYTETKNLILYYGSIVLGCCLALSVLGLSIWGLSLLF